MSDTADQRIAALGRQLVMSPDVPPITKVASPSAGPRVQGKVAIITG